MNKIICKHPNCTDSPGAEFLSTGFCGKHQQLSLSGVSRTQTATNLASIANRQKNLDSIYEEIDSQGFGPHSVPSELAGIFEQAVEDAFEVDKEEMEFVIWENEPVAFRDNNKDELWDSVSPELIDFGNEDYIDSINKLEKVLDNLNGEHGEFSFKLKDGGVDLVAGSFDTTELDEAVGDVQKAIKSHREWYLGEGLRKSTEESYWYDQGYESTLENLTDDQIALLAEHMAE